MEHPVRPGPVGLAAPFLRSVTTGDAAGSGVSLHTVFVTVLLGHERVILHTPVLGGGHIILVWADDICSGSQVVAQGGKLLDRNQISFASVKSVWSMFCGANAQPRDCVFIVRMLFRALKSSREKYAQAPTLFDWFDGGSENRNFPNLAFLAEMSSQMNMSVESSRLVVHHSHNDGDALIGHPRRAYK